MSASRQRRVVDLAIVGGGPVGMALAALLGSRGLHVALIENSEPPAEALDERPDLRVFAITRASARLLECCGVWGAIRASNRRGVFRSMRVWDAGSSGHIEFDSAAICEPLLGYIVENSLLCHVLEQGIEALETVRWYRPASLSAYENEGRHVHLELTDGGSLAARLLVGADGGRSQVRRLAGIATRERDYRQSAVVATVQTTLPHGDCARQRFLPDGPLAFLPLADPRRCAMVWSTSPGHAEALKEISPTDFGAAVAEAFESCLGEVELLGSRAGFPLSRAHATAYVKPRLALVGDSAHRIHPLAGQGANLGLMDVAALAQVILEARDRGRQDCGRHALLRRYERWRRGENLAMMLAMDLLRDGFGSSNILLRGVRGLGLGVANRSPTLKAVVMRRAMGLEGDLPDLITQAGEAASG